MKKCGWILISLSIAAAVCLTACAKKSAVDTAPLEKSFSSAEPATQTTVDKAVSAIKAGDYTGALTELKTLASNAKLTPEQQQAVKDVMAQVQTAVTEAAAKMKDQVTKGAEDLQKSLPK